jgi:hypothetical protein
MTMTKPTDQELENSFRYHRPDADSIAKHGEVTELTLALAKHLRNICPDGRNLSLALTHLEDVRMRANAAIACDTKPAAPPAAPAPAQPPAATAAPEAAAPIDTNQPPQPTA